MKSLKNMTGDSLEQMIDYKVVDQNGETIGSLHSLWSDPTTGGVEFLGVKTGWLFGHNHVVPAEKAELDETENVVRLPYTEVFIKEAPSMPADSEISEVEEDNIYQYYGLPSPTHVDTGISPLEANKAAIASDSEGVSMRWRRTSRSEISGANASDTVAEPGEESGAAPIAGGPGSPPQ